MGADRRARVALKAGFFNPVGHKGVEGGISDS
jgi:hypothetical protein